MQPLIRVILAIVGAALGATLAGSDFHLLAAVIGGLAGIAIGEVAFLRKSIRTLEEEVHRLREAIIRQPTTQSERAQSVQRPPEAAPAAPLAPIVSAPLPYRPVAKVER